MDEFKKHCEIIKELIERGEILPHIVNANLVGFRYPENSIDVWVEKNKLGRKRFVRDLGQIPVFILTALRNDLSLAFRYFSPPNPDAEKGSEQRKVIEEKVTIAREAFITSEIADIFVIKSTAKTRLLGEIDWEVSERVFDRDMGTVSSLKHAQLSLKTASSDRSPSFPFWSFFPESGSGNDLVLTLAIDDINYLLRELEEMKRVISNE